MMSMRRAATLGPPEAGVATYNVVAAFPSPESARMAADALGRVPIPADRITLTPAEEGLAGQWPRSEEHTSELQSHSDIVCRLLLEKKNTLTGSGYATARRS